MVVVALLSVAAIDTLAAAQQAVKKAPVRARSTWSLVAATDPQPAKSSKKQSAATPVQKPAAKSKAAKEKAKEPSTQAPPQKAAVTDAAAKPAAASDAASDAATKDRDEGPDALAQKFAELLSKRRAESAAGAASAKAPQPPPKEQVPPEPVPKPAPAAKPAPATTATGDEPAPIQVLVLGNADDLADVRRTERIGRLILTGDNFSNRSLRGLDGLTVAELSIEAVHVSNAGLQYIKSVQGLRHLRLWTPAVDDSALKQLAELPTLEILDVEGTAIEGAGFEELKGLRKLEMLVLGPKTSDAQIASLKHLPALRQLDLRACTRLTLACLEPLAQLADLQTVWLPGHIRAKGKRILKESLPTCEVRS